MSDHTPVEADAKTLPFAESEPGATGLELLLPLALQWGAQSGAGLARAIEVVTSAPARLIASGPAAQVAPTLTQIGRLAIGGPADICVIDPDLEWQVLPDALRSQGKHTPFSGYALRGAARHTLIAGRIVHSA